MSRLVAEKRLDKNGVLTTKHIRADKPTPASRSAIPAPVVAKTQRLSSKADYAQKLTEEFVGHYDETDRAKLAAKLTDKLSIKALRSVNRFADRMDPDNELDRKIFSEAVFTLVTKKSDPGKEQREKMVYVLMEVTPVISKFSGSPSSPYVSLDVAAAVNYGAKVNRIDFNEGAASDTDKAMLQYTAFEYMVKKVNTSRTKEWLLDESAWFTDNMDRLSPHRHKIMMRGTTDRDFLSELAAEGSSAVLSEGTL